MSDQMPPPPPADSPTPGSWPDAPPPPAHSPTPGGSWPDAPPPPPSASPSPFGGPAPANARSASENSTAGLRKAAIILYWVTTAATALFLVAVASRKSTWSDFESGGDVTFSDLDAADGFVGGAVLLLIGLALATTIVVSIWALRVARNARQTGATGVSPGLACGGWYIPFANTVVPFLQLRRIAQHRRRPTQMVNAWMGLAIATLVFSIIFRTGDGSLDVGDDVSGTLTREVVFAALMLVATAAMAFVAMRAMRQADGD